MSLLTLESSEKIDIYPVLPENLRSLFQTNEHEIRKTSISYSPTVETSKVWKYNSYENRKINSLCTSLGWNARTRRNKPRFTKCSFRWAKVSISIWKSQVSFRLQKNWWANFITQLQYWRWAPCRRIAFFRRDISYFTAPFIRKFFISQFTASILRESKWDTIFAILASMRLGIRKQ